MSAQEKSELQLACERFELARAQLSSAEADLRQLVNQQMADARRYMKPRRGCFTQRQVDCIVEIVSAHHDVAAAQILSRDRYARVVDARQRAMALVYSMLNPTLSRTGELFQRDHMTVRYAVTQITNRCSLDQRYAEDFAALRAKCASALQLL